MRHVPTIGKARPINAIVEHVGEDALVPVYPKPADAQPGAKDFLRLAQRDLLSIWWDQAYDYKIMPTRILGRQITILNNPHAIQHVMVGNHDNYERKAPQQRRALEQLLGDGLFISDGDTWKFRRREVAATVHRRKLDIFAPVMVDTTEEMVAHWESLGDGAEVDALVEMADLTAEIIARAVFGAKLGRDKTLEVIQGFTDFQKVVNQINIAYFMGADEGWPMFPGPRRRASIKRVHRVIDELIADHLAGNGDPNSMIAMLMKSVDPKTDKPMTAVELRNEAATIFMAGHETTAATLTWAWYLLSRAGWAEARLHAELEEVLGGRTPTLADVPKLKYTRAIIDETLRLYPPVPILGRQAREADKIGNYEIDAKSLILVIPWLLHRHKDFWDRPHNFEPERFLDKRPKFPFAYVPFAVGPRVCAGTAFGQVEAVLCLATLAQKFRVRVAERAEVVPQCRLTLRPRGGLPVTLHPRRDRG
ncbi:MAG: cytochrome P450 [Pseudomonadota bacterium]|nr:cytochrome P450 [Pseudomonadota bacterium]